MQPLPKKQRTAKRRGRHPHKALSAAFCRTVGQAGRYADGNGLYLHVDPSGARRWVQKLVIRRKVRVLGLGGYSLVSLAEAREQALANRMLARSGGDPLAAKRRHHGVPTFEQAAAEVLKQKSGAWRNPKHAADWPTSLRLYAFPLIGDQLVSDITSADLLQILSPIWHDKPETARRVRQRIGTVMKWAVAMQHRPDNPAGEALGEALGRQRAVVVHMPALPHGEVASAVAAVRASRAWAGAKLAFEFLVLTAARSGEVRLATWNEIHLDTAVWTVPRRPHEGGARPPGAAERTRRGGSARGTQAWRRHRAGVPESAREGAHGQGALAARPETGASGPFRTVSARRSGTGRRSVRTTLGRSSRRRWRTWCRTRPRRPTRGRTCSSGVAS